MGFTAKEEQILKKMIDIEKAKKELSDANIVFNENFKNQINAINELKEQIDKSEINTKSSNLEVLNRELKEMI